MLEHSRGIGRPLRAHLIFEVAFSASERCFPFVALLDPDLVVYIAEVDFCEDLCTMEPIQHLRYEGEGVAIFDSHFVETPVVHD